MKEHKSQNYEFLLKNGPKLRRWKKGWGPWLWLLTLVTYDRWVYILIFFKYLFRFFVLVLLSTHIKRFSVSLMQDFVHCFAIFCEAILDILVKAIWILSERKNILLPSGCVSRRYKMLLSNLTKTNTYIVKCSINPSKQICFIKSYSEIPVSWQKSKGNLC